MAQLNSALKVVYIETSKNEISDALLRLHKGKEQHDRFKQLTKNIEVKETEVNEGLFEFSHSC